MDDFQGFRSPTPYESTKRLIDLLVLTRNLPSVRPHSASFLAPEGDDAAGDDGCESPRMYVSQPGIVASTLFPLPWFLFWAYHLVTLIARWLGSPWHTVDPYSASKAAAWIILQEQSALDALNAERVKWGSSTDRSGRGFVKETEVDRWGWQGKVEDVSVDVDGVTGVLRKRIGRDGNATDVTEEELVQFEELGAECWDEMEDLRQEWTEILELDAPKPNGKSRQ